MSPTSYVAVDSGSMTVSVRHGAVVVEGREVKIAPGSTFAVIFEPPRWLRWVPFPKLLTIKAL